MTSPLCKCLVGKTKLGQRCAKWGSGDFQQQGRKRNWFPLAPGATRLETCCLWPDPVFRHCWLIFWPIPAGSRIRPALHTQCSMFFPQQVSACRICSTFIGPEATWDYREENTMRVRPWCIPLAVVLCFLGDSRKPNGKYWSSQRPQKCVKRTPVLDRHASFPEAVSLESITLAMRKL